MVSKSTEYNHQIKYLYNPDDLSREVRNSNVGDVFVTVNDSKTVIYMCVVSHDNLPPLSRIPYWMQLMDSNDERFNLYYNITTGLVEVPTVKVGDKIYVPNEKRPYKVKCRDNRYIICTKPMNLYHTVLYFIIDLHRGLRGPDNMVFCSGYETDEQCQDRLKELQSGQIEVSTRRSVKLDVLVQ